ncbi:hypothetical protein GQ43DRAFT_454705 [Delitschia confertaspora ATCC 74209]|uniref:Zn(2)-C6 fungal-type domain-containing protein n=1 Tax=Delitschia confertaspora ATCC 74209 TaxID=1513339 RepID=A0A9P4JP07_9PLEO|nr:hypothetical protein GQ43DRAFT_454705 [Delitschia confertaspora ATCC 74209]
MARSVFMDLSVDIKTLIVEHVIRPSDLVNLCLVCKELHEITVRQLYREVALDIGSPDDMKLGSFLSPKNIGLPHIRKVDLYLANVSEKCNQMRQADFATRMILELLPENILEKFSWHPWSPFSGDNLLLLYKKQKRLKWLEAIALDRDILPDLQKIPDFAVAMPEARKLGLYPDNKEVLDLSHFLLKNTPKVEKLTLHASFREHTSNFRELNDSSTGPGLITSTLFRHMQPFSKCTPLALKQFTAQKINLRYAADTYCKVINFRSVKSIRIFDCPGADAFFAELGRSAKLPEKLDTLEFKHADNPENDGLSAVDGFLCLVSGIEVLTLDLTRTKSLPAPAGLSRHGKTLRELIVHASAEDDDDELVYDYSSFSQICRDCPGIEQISIALPECSVLRGMSDRFMDYENCLGGLPNLITLNITTWPNHQPSSSKLPRKVYEHLLQGMAQQGFERGVSYATEHNRTSRLAIIAFGTSDKVYDREESENQIIFAKGKQVDPLGQEKPLAIQKQPSRNFKIESSWGTATMSSQYPPPPAPEETHYAPIYPATPNTQLLDNGGQQQMNYSPQNIFPKLENINDVLQQQAHQANHALTDQRNNASPMSGDPQPKTNRLRKACDSCSIRKVKCDESGPPCRACASLDIPCTFDRPSRRRGPPNRHAEAIKKKRRIEGADPISGPSTPASPTNAAHALAQLSSHPAHLSAESICSLPIMNALIDDFFTYIHPLCPFPHEPSFREAWDQREDYQNPSFLALLASMIAALVASFPRKPRHHLKGQTKDHFPSHLALVDKCREVCAQARGPGYLDRPGLNVYDACTSYFLALTGAYTFQWRQLRLYFGECLTILRSLGLHKAHEQSYTQLGGIPAFMGSNGSNFDGSREFQLDKITEQIGRRVFWTVFVGVRTIQQLGASFGELTLLPSTPSEPHPPLPAEVDDACIFPHEIMSQPVGTVSLITAFNTNVRIYASYSTLSTMEMAFGINELFDWDRQQRILDQCLRSCKHVMDNIPDVLKVMPKDAQNARFRPPRQPYYPPIPEYMSHRDSSLPNFNTGDPHEARREAQYEIQKANIYASHLSIRSYLVEKYFSLLDKYNQQHSAQNQPQDPTGGLAAGFDTLVSPTSANSQELEKNMADEREHVVKDLLIVLGSIDLVNMEPNGDSFTQKIRQIASTLLEVPQERKGSVALQHQDYLYKFLDVLSKLERASPEGSDPNGVLDDEMALRHWSDLKEYQIKFQEQGGIYGFSQ